MVISISQSLSLIIAVDLLFPRLYFTTVALKSHVPGNDAMGQYGALLYNILGGGGWVGVLRPVGIWGHLQGENIRLYLLIQSGDDDYLMNETRRKPTTGRQPPSLFDKWHGIFYMPSRIDTAVHTKGLITQSRSTGGTEMFSAARTRTMNY